MELFDETGTEYYRNIIWIIVFALVGAFITNNYYNAVEQEKIEATYIETVGHVKNSVEWERTRMRNGRVQGSSQFFKFNYHYYVNGKQFGGSSEREKQPPETIPIYYNAKNPATHVFKRKSSEDERAFLIIGGIIILAFTVINICLYQSKKKKTRDFS